jgi:hypothetical protein
MDRSLIPVVTGELSHRILCLAPGINLSSTQKSPVRNTDRRWERYQRMGIWYVFLSNVSLLQFSISDHHFQESPSFLLARELNWLSLPILCVLIMILLYAWSWWSLNCRVMVTRAPETKSHLVPLWFLMLSSWRLTVKEKKSYSNSFHQPARFQM